MLICFFRADSDAVHSVLADPDTCLYPVPSQSSCAGFRGAPWFSIQDPVVCRHPTGCRAMTNRVDFLGASRPFFKVVARAGFSTIFSSSFFFCARMSYSAPASNFFLNQSKRHYCLPEVPLGFPLPSPRCLPHETGRFFSERFPLSYSFQKRMCFCFGSSLSLLFRNVLLVPFPPLI